MTPALRLDYQRNDNIRMTLQPHNTVDGTIIAPSLNVGVRSATWGITGEADAERRRYSGDEGLDSDNETFRLSSFYKMERNSFTLNASRMNDTTLAQEFEDSDVGFVTVQRVRRTETLQPRWTWYMTGRAQLQLSYQLSEVSYVDGKSDGLYDYRWRQASATWSYLLSPRSQFFLGANYSWYRAPDTSIHTFSIVDLPSGPTPVAFSIFEVDSRTPSFNVGIGHAFSATMQGTLMIGRRKTSTEQTGMGCSLFIIGVCFPHSQTIHDTGITFSGDLKKEFETLNITASVSRDIAASGAGVEIETDQFFLQANRPITARLDAKLIASGSKSRRIAGATTLDTNIKQYFLQPGLNWQWTREAEASLFYRYRHLQRESEDQAAQGHTVSLSLAYNWPRYSISR
jgi:hypothetical protein